jgi:hypothetical protein
MSNAKSLAKDDPEFVIDCARYSERILSRPQIMRKYPALTDDDWNELDTPELLAKIELETTRRIRNGTSARERAALIHATRSIDVADQILSSEANPPRVRLESAAFLAKAATPPAEVVPGSDSNRFIITINLGADAEGKEIIEHYNKPREITPDADAAPMMLPAIAASKQSDGGGSGGLA